MKKRQPLKESQQGAVARAVEAARVAVQPHGVAVLTFVLLDDGQTGLGVAGVSVEAMDALIGLVPGHLSDWLERLRSKQAGALIPIAIPGRDTN
jgi:hypothetical protein